MRTNYVITIGREYGSGGREIAEKLAKSLNISFYDKNLINIVAERSGYRVEILDKADEKAANPLFSGYNIPPGFDVGTINDKLFWNQSSVIKDLAQKESCVIVGRCADYVLRDMDNVLNVFIQASMEARINRIMDRYLIDVPNIAKKEIQREDKIRRSYYQFYTDRKWGGNLGHHLVIDSSVLGVDGTVELIRTMAKMRFDLE